MTYKKNRIIEKLKADQLVTSMKINCTDSTCRKHYNTSRKYSYKKHYKYVYTDYTANKYQYVRNYLYKVILLVHYALYIAVE